MLPCRDLCIFESFERIFLYGNPLWNLLEEVSDFQLPKGLETYCSYLAGEADVSPAIPGARFVVFLVIVHLIQ